jgi:choline dehydrogenase-like flavoprotein
LYSGLTVASRLTDDPAVSVAVIEAGFNAEGLQEVFLCYQNDFSSILTVLQVFIPGLIGTGIDFTTLDWNYPTVPQTNLNNRVLKVNAGKALGGSSIINSMIFVRPFFRTNYAAVLTLSSSPAQRNNNMTPGEP